MSPLFAVRCSTGLARALGAVPMVRVDRPNLSFPVYDQPTTHHAALTTDDGPFAWLWLLDRTHMSITRGLKA